MTNTPPETPAPPGPGATDEATATHEGRDAGPRVTGEELRDLARLRRSRSDKKIAGVAGGISRYLDIDPIITRVALVVLVFFGGAGLIVYAACWLIVPLEGETRAPVRLDDRSRAVALAFVGVLAVLALLGDSLGGWGFPWPLAVIGVIVVTVMLFRGRKDPQLDHPQPGYQQPGWPQPGHPQPDDRSAPAQVPPPVGYAATYPVGRPKRRGPLLFWYTIAIIAIGVGVLGSIDLAGVDVVPSAYPALALIASGAMLLLGAFWGRPGGLILLGLVSAVATAAMTTAGELDTGQIDRTPTTSAGLANDYELDVGEIVLDLREIADLERLDGRTVTLDLAVGRIAVIVPDDLGVTVTSDLGVGDSTVFGDASEGGAVTTTVDGGPDAPTLILDVTVGLGEIDITREGSTS